MALLNFCSRLEHKVVKCNDLLFFALADSFFFKALLKRSSWGLVAGRGSSSFGVRLGIPVKEGE